MADKYIKLDLADGRKKTVEATVSSTGVSEAGNIVALDSAGKLDASVMPIGVGADTKSVIASENLSAGDFVNFWDDTGTEKVRKADATTSGKEADGFVLSAVTSGNNALVYNEGVNNQLSALTIGARYYLDKTTAGGVVTDVSGFITGNVVQFIGRAISATEISFEGEEGTIVG